MLSNNVKNLQNTILEEIPLIGIKADTVYVIISTDIVNIGEINYLSIFKNIMK